MSHLSAARGDCMAEGRLGPGASSSSAGWCDGVQDGLDAGLVRRALGRDFGGVDHEALAVDIEDPDSVQLSRNHSVLRAQRKPRDRPNTTDDTERSASDAIPRNWGCEVDADEPQHGGPTRSATTRARRMCPP